MWCNMTRAYIPVTWRLHTFVWMPLASCIYVNDLSIHSCVMITFAYVHVMWHNSCDITLTYVHVCDVTFSGVRCDWFTCVMCVMYLSLLWSCVMYLCLLCVMYLCVLCVMYLCVMYLSLLWRVWCICVSCARQTVAVCCSVLQCVAACCSVLQCVAVCCSVLQCIAALSQLCKTGTTSGAQSQNELKKSYRKHLNQRM